MIEYQLASCQNTYLCIASGVNPRVAASSNIHWSGSSNLETSWAPANWAMSNRLLDSALHNAIYPEIWGSAGTRSSNELSLSSISRRWSTNSCSLHIAGQNVHWLSRFMFLLCNHCRFCRFKCHIWMCDNVDVLIILLTGVARSGRTVGRSLLWGAWQVRVCWQCIKVAFHRVR